MGWVLRLIGTGAANAALCADVMEISCSSDVCDIRALGLTLSEGKQLLARVQQAVVAAQAQSPTTLRPDCSRCGGRCHVNDWRLHQIATAFGTVAVRSRGFFVSAAVTSRTVSPGHRIVGRHRIWTSCERISLP